MSSEHMLLKIPTWVRFGELSNRLNRIASVSTAPLENDFGNALF